MSRRKMKTGDLNPSEKAQLFSSEILEIYAAVSDNGYDSRSEVSVSKELQSYLLSQNIGQVARSFTGSYKTSNVHDSVVSLVEQLHEFEAKQYRQMNDDEIVNGFWNMTEGKMPQKPRMTDREWDAHQELRAARRAEKLAAKAERASSGGFAARESERREAPVEQSASR